MSHTRSLIAVLVAAGLGCGGGQAAAPPPEAPPPPTAEPPAAAAPAPAPAPPPAPPGALQIPVEYHKLDNGLRVVLSPRADMPTAVVAVYYHIGFRIEPKDRTGFAHLFEHMMFQGSKNLGKMEFIKLIQSNGGLMNGSTRFDFTNYFQVVPAGALELVLWAEADRMGSLAVNADNLKNQQGVVSNEVRVNVLNRPYGGFPWLDMPQLANSNWFNAHNFYGDLKDLEAATLEDVKTFFETYYQPSNAVVVVTGGIDSRQTLEWVKKHFGPLPSKPRPTLPDVSEPPQTAEKRHTKNDPLAPRPALAFSYHVPPRRTPEHAAMTVLMEILADGKDSALHRALVLEKGITDEVATAINELGNPWNYEGPMLMTTWLFHDPSSKPDDILAIVDAEIARLVEQPVDAATLERARTKLRSGFYDTVEALNGFGRADLLAALALFDDDPSRINHIEAEIAAVTPELVQATAKKWLARTNRSVLVVEPGKGAP
jgi:predicted Zn-dependent peptidase